MYFYRKWLSAFEVINFRHVVSFLIIQSDFKTMFSISGLGKYRCSQHLCWEAKLHPSTDGRGSPDGQCVSIKISSLYGQGGQILLHSSRVHLLFYSAASGIHNMHVDYLVHRKEAARTPSGVPKGKSPSG
jgi:hypothetical protein